MISRWRIIILAVLFTLPLLLLMGVGAYALWQWEWWAWAWWPMVGCLTLAYYLAWRWQAAKKLLTVDFEPELHWTERDKEAWTLVEARAKTIVDLGPEKLSNLNFYVDTGKEMALELARIYHPGAKDPIGSLTIPEILAVIELASHDLSQMVRQYLPAGHLLTINDWRRAQQATKWYQVGSNIYWAISTIFAPYKTAVRFLASNLGISKPLALLQQNILVWFFTAYVHRMGTYLIDLHSGRLRVGAERYRELVQGMAPKESLGDPRAGGGEHELPQDLVPSRDSLPAHVTITLMGQVKAGKSSLINALLGQQRAETSVLPETEHVIQYELKPENVPNELLLLDTVGYGHEGPKADQMRATQTAAQKADLLLLVLHAKNPARQADLEMLTSLKKWFDDRPDLKMPPILAVVTHIDLLSPQMEWDPPYRWESPVRPKEQNIEQAIASVREQLGDHLVGAVPVCTAEGRVYGVEEWLVPTIAQLIEETRAVALLRCLHAEANEGKIRRVFEQVLAGGRELAKVLWQEALKS